LLAYNAAKCNMRLETRWGRSQRSSRSSIAGFKGGAACGVEGRGRKEEGGGREGQKGSRKVGEWGGWNRAT